MAELAAIIDLAITACDITEVPEVAAIVTYQRCADAYVEDCELTLRHIEGGATKPHCFAWRTQGKTSSSVLGRLPSKPAATTMTAHRVATGVQWPKVGGVTADDRITGWQQAQRSLYMLNEHAIWAKGFGPLRELYLDDSMKCTLENARFFQRDEEPAYEADRIIRDPIMHKGGPAI